MIPIEGDVEQCERDFVPGARGPNLDSLAEILGRLHRGRFRLVFFRHLRG